MAFNSKKVRYLLIAGVLFTLVLVESLCHSYWLNKDTSDLVSLVYLFCGIGIAFLPLIPVQFSGLVWEKRYPFIRFVVWILFARGLYLIAQFGWLKTAWIFDEIPVGIEVADMLPIMKIMSQRFLAGEPVYEIIPEIWGGIPPIYLPAMWLPYMPAIAQGFDMRWISQGMVLLGVIFAWRLPYIGDKRPLQVLLVLIPLCLLVYYFFQTDFRLFAVTEEGIVIGYYLFLAYALMTDNPWIKGLAIALCLMSRYVLVFWVPFYLAYVFLQESRRNAYIIAGVGAGICLLLMIGTGAIYHLETFLDMPKIYLEAVQDPNNSWKYEQTLNESLGLGKYLGVENLGLLHHGLFLFSLLSPLSFFLWMYFRPHSLNKPFWALCSLKMSLVVFYQFLVINPLYLFYTSTFFSFGILYHYLAGWKMELS
ncbi:MAG: hypothetical protein AAF694_06055 [Bacteroidota bacterium]